MPAFQRISDTEAVFRIDRMIYSDAVISKALYWLTREFTIDRRMESEACEEVSFRISDGGTPPDWDAVQQRLSQSLADFKLREIIITETDAIRNILYIKAFSPNLSPNADQEKMDEA